MSSQVSTLVTNLKTIVSNVLGSTYVELPFSYNIEKNSRTSGEKGYAVVPQSVTETDSVTRYVTADQNFEIILNQSFSPDQTSEASKKSIIITMYDLLFDIYDSIVTNKAGSTNVMIVNNMNISDPEFLEDNDFVILRMVINIKHRYSI